MNRNTAEMGVEMSNLKFTFVLAFLLLGLGACATRGKPLGSSVFILSTDKSTTTLLNGLAEEFRANKYEVETLNNSLGILSFVPRKFVIPREGKKTTGEQLFQLRQEGGSVKISLTYRCEDPEVGGWGPCYDRDRAANTKIARIESLIMEILNRHMFKDRSESIPESKLIE